MAKYVSHCLTFSVSRVLFCHSAQRQVFAACALVMHLVLLKACNFKTTQPIFLLSFYNFGTENPEYKVKTHKEYNIIPAAVQRNSCNTVFSYTDSDKHTHMNMHSVKVAETCTHSVLMIH